MFSNPSRTHIRLTSIICLVVMLAVLVAGCGGPAPTPTAVPKAAEPTKAPAAGPTAVPPTAVPPTAAPKKTVVLKMARSMEPFSVFVPWQIDDNPAVFLSVNVYDTLVRVSKDGFSVEPSLASKWESSADGLTWTFTLRDNLKFSDGTPLKASDAKASLDMVRTGEKSITWKDSYAAIKEIQAPDDKTIKVVLKQPFAALLSTMALFSGAVLPADYAKATDAKTFDPNTAWKTKGSGAYYCEGWKKGEVIVLKRNPYYWKGTPAVDEVRIEYIPDDNTRVLKLQGGEVDVIDFVPLSQIAALNTQPNIKAQAFPIQQSTFVILNTEAKPLNDVKVRQALNYATDKEAIIKTVYFGQALFMNAGIPRGMYWDKNSPGYVFNLDKAKQLMKESSVPSGFTLDMQTRSGNADHANIATILKDQWAKIGVTVNIQPLETSVVRTNYREGKFMSTPSAWTNDMNDPTQIVNYAMRGGANPFAYWTRWNNPAVNDQITKADLEQDVKKREAIYLDLQKTHLEAAPLVFLVYNPATAAWRSYVEGFMIEGLSHYHFEDVKVNK